ncbi:excise [Mycobacterium phage Jabbawokkie]|uniref:Excise n=1 Tax=Mycobacterium phage Zapner TaxID=1486474 RepID=A0A059VB28_9CAUD|nr:excise [Mycobacterium phage Jabbawokkie]YP_009963979.1 excise [Mycobacterium phage Zapner]AGT12162.1 excise [Mycobacterium phage Jabbawokkie]AHZ95516.1 excise [Mycobacterium phage Zapner]
MSESPWRTPPEAAEYVRLKTPDLLREAVRNGELKAYGAGRHMRFKTTDLDEWMESHPFEPSSRAS